MTELNMGQKIKVLRKEHGLTLEQVGNAVGVGKSTVRKWEAGIIANMRRDKIAALAKVLHTTPAYLMGWESETDNLPSNMTQLDDNSYTHPLMEIYERLNEEGQSKLMDYAEDLDASGRYKKNNQSDMGSCG